MKKMIQETFWKLIFNIGKNYINFIMIYNFYQPVKPKKKKPVANMCDKFKAGITSWISIENIAQSHQIQTRSLTKTIN